MNAQGAIPIWLQWAWALAGLGIAAGGLLWIIGIFWPYLRWSKAMMLRSYELGERTASYLAELQAELKPLVEDARRVVTDAARLLKDGGRMERALESLERLLKETAPDPEREAALAGERADIENRIKRRRDRRKGGP